jgi:hypothetical protein
VTEYKEAAYGREHGQIVKRSVNGSTKTLVTEADVRYVFTLATQVDLAGN